LGKPAAPDYLKGNLRIVAPCYAEVLEEDVQIPARTNPLCGFFSDIFSCLRAIIHVHLILASRQDPGGHNRQKAKESLAIEYFQKEGE
jgi:hypothetical protein